VSKHTPGPWYVGSKATVGPRSSDDDQSFGMVIPLADIYGDNRTANALLIAAAPELLAALQELLSESSDGIATSPLTRNKARAAIAKATGETK